jgi:hypothetical protein
MICASICRSSAARGLEFGVVVPTSGDLIADVGDVALALHGGDGGALVLLRLAFDALILKRPPVDPGVVAVALKMAVRQLLPCVPYSGGQRSEGGLAPF